MGFTDVEEGEALGLCGYQGDRRTETAELIVCRRHIGSASNDLGFRRTEGGYVPVISEYDQRTLVGGGFLPRLRTAYAEHVVETVRKRLRGSVQRVTEGSVIKLRVRY
jgi:ABC-type sugar transport system ATPase subunit